MATRNNALIFLLLFLGVASRVGYDYFKLGDLVENEMKVVGKQIGTLLADHKEHLDQKYEAIALNYQHNRRFSSLVKKEILKNFTKS